MLPLAGIVQAAGLALAAAKLPFPVMCIGYALVGFGNTTQDALGNAYAAGLPNTDFQLAILHTAYGLGAACSPLISTAFVTHGKSFNLFYLTSLAFSLLNVGLLCWSFKFEHELAEQTVDIELSSRPVVEEGETAAHLSSAAPEEQPRQPSPDRQIQHHVSLASALKVFYVDISAFWVGSRLYTYARSLRLSSSFSTWEQR